MLRIGLTGGIGCGKTTVASWIASRGIPLVDTDDLARRLVEPGQPALTRIRERFGSQIVGPDGALDRSSLGSLVFADAAARSDLEAILHPLIHQGWMAALDKWEALGHPQAVVVIPLLFEKAYQGLFGRVVSVACSALTQRERLRNRGWDDSQIEARIASQWSIEAKMQASHKVLWSEGRISALHAQADRVFGQARDPRD